jgi:peptide/nickel transport system permease protein
VQPDASGAAWGRESRLDEGRGPSPARGGRDVVTQFLVRRFLFAIVVLLVDVLLVFSLLHLTPGDPALLIVGGERGGVGGLEAIRQQLGLDRPFHEQFLSYLGGLVRGDMGRSFFSQQPVFEMLASRLPMTLQLAAVSLLIAIVIGVPTGIFAALKRNTAWDQGFMLIALFGVSMPGFWLALVLMLVFSVTLGWFPLVGYVSPAQDVGAWLRHITLPAVAIGFAQSALIARMARSSLLEVLRQDYVALTAKAKGLSPAVIVLKHALANAALPLVTVIGLSFAALIGGVVIIEEVFALPGVGSLLINAVSRRDYFVIMGCLVLIAAANVLMNLLVDVSYAVIDPRVRYD